MSTSEHVSALLQQLVHTILPPGAPSEERSQQASYLSDLAHRLLKVARRTGGPAGIHQALQFQQLHRKLVAQSSSAEAAGVAPLMTHRPKLLYLLQAMQGQEAQAQASAAFTSHFNETQHMVPAQQSQQRSAPQEQQVAAYTPPAAAATSLTSSLAAQQSAKLLLTHSASSLSESELLRDLLFTLLGANGNYVQFNAKVDAFLVLPSVQLSNEVRTLVQRIAELGWLYRKISTYVAQVMEGEQIPTAGSARSNGSSASSILSRKQSQPTHEHAGKIEQSFGATLRDELNDYIRLVTLLETQVETANAESAAASQALVVAAAASSSASAPSSAPAAHSTSAFTLRRMWVWVQNPLRHLGLLGMLVDESRGITGGCLASHLGRYLNHGDPFVVALVKRLMRKTCVPLFEMIHRWVCTGTLADPYAEFFVRSTPGVSAERLWADKYSLRREMVPTTFLPPRTVHRILGIGKAVNFLKTNCKKQGFKAELDVDWNQSLRTTQGQHLFQHGTDLSAFNSSIDLCFTAVNTALVSCLHQDYHLGSHALALKKFMLLAQGDFHQLLMDSVSRELEKPARETSTTALMGMLEQAKRGSSARFESEEIMQRLSLKKISTPTVVSASSPTIAGAEVGWDVFTLLYTLSDSPLSVIFTSSSLEAYQTLFNFLLRLKRVEGQLNAAWAKQTKLGHSIKLINLSKLLTPKDAAGSSGGNSNMNNTLDPLLKQCNGLRHEMLHFLTNTHSYLMFEVLESAWEEFIKKINPVKPAAAPTAAAGGVPSSLGSGRHERTASTAIVPVATGVAAPASASSASHTAASFAFGGAAAPAAASSGPASAASNAAPKPLDLEGLIKAHKVFLQQIMDKALLGGDSQPLLSQLLSLFQLILSFCAFTDRLYDFLGAEIERREAQQAQHARQKSGSAWGASALAAVKSAADPSIVACIQTLTGFLRDFQRLAHDFSVQFREFLRALKQSNSEAADKIGGASAAGASKSAPGAPMGTPSKAAHNSASNEWDADDDVLDRSDSMMSPLPLGRSSSSAAAAASSGLSAAARAQRHAANLHELDFLRFRLDFNEYYRTNKEAHRRRQAAYAQQQAHMAPKPALTSAQINQQRAAAAAAGNPPGRFVNPKAWEE